MEPKDSRSAMLHDSVKRLTEENAHLRADLQQAQAKSATLEKSVQVGVGTLELLQAFSRSLQCVTEADLLETLNQMRAALTANPSPVAEVVRRVEALRQVDMRTKGTGATSSFYRAIDEVYSAMIVLLEKQPGVWEGTKPDSLPGKPTT